VTSGNGQGRASRSTLPELRASSASTTASTGTIWAFWVDTDGNGVAGSSGDYLLTDTDGDGIIDTGNLNQGQSLAILVTANIPPGSPDKLSGTLTITGTSSRDTNVYDTQSYTTTVTAPVFTLAKEVSPSGNQPPGTELTYTITATNIGTGIGTSIVVSDIIPPLTTYVPGSIKTGSSLATLVARTDANDGDGAQYDASTGAGGTVITNGTALGAGGTLILQFKVTIN